MKKKITLLFIICIGLHMSFGQVKPVTKLDTTFLNWYNKDYTTSAILGTSVDKAYEFIHSRSKKGKTVIVAVIDSGVDIYHEDLEGQIWVNEDEIPNNNIDDDGNGYVDDVHGWNFIGNKDGQNIHYENLEYVRIVRQNDNDYPDLAKAKQLFKVELAKRKREKENIHMFQQAFNNALTTIKKKTGVSVNSKQDLEKIRSRNLKVLNAKSFLMKRYAAGFTKESLQNIIRSNDEYLNYFLNLDFNARTMVGDNPNDITDRYYGNPDVKGPRSDHGTSVAGIIAAIRNNNLGINGIASNVKIMALRSTPRGDERDKDVALSIYYAVENGADIINMSFGKDFSPQKKFIDDAVKYAEEKGVLIIHGAGNSGQNIDVKERFPSDRYLDRSEASNWLNVGASTYTLDAKVVASFSNFGQKHVDLFAPGVNIISTDSTNTYSMHDGTSLSAPVATGVAALLLSYYPELTPQELIDILLTSSFKFTKPKKVLMPSSNSKKSKKVKFSKLSKSGGIINAYNAFIEAEKRKG